MKKKYAANLLMILLALMILGAGIWCVGSVRGWFDGETATAVLEQVTGSVTLERQGVAYPAQAGDSLRSDDRLQTDDPANARLAAQSSWVALDSHTELTIENAQESNLTLHLLRGSVFLCAPEDGLLTIQPGDGERLQLTQGAIWVTVTETETTISILSGNLLDAQAGERLTWAGDTYTAETLFLDALDDFAIGCVRDANEALALCFTNEDLDALVEQRLAEQQAQLEEQLKDNATSEEADEPENPEAESQPDASSAPEKSTSTPTQTPDTNQEITQPADTNPQTPDPEPEPQPEETPATPAEPENTALRCTVAIYCSTILNNMDSLDPDKAAYVPSSGVLLSPVTVEFTQGESAFDVLKRACSAAGIALEYSWTPMYNSYYVEGIGNLYEFDCGSESGWMFKVNGSFPNYGASGYTLSDGDNVVWCYTCTGLGADVGA
jgi:hypothetical protein